MLEKREKSKIPSNNSVPVGGGPDVNDPDLAQGLSCVFY